MQPPWPFNDLPRHHYGVVLADPGWHHATYSAKGEGRSPKYRTASISAIAALPVADLAADDCWLFLWTTSQHLALAIERIIPAWGFRYSSTAFCWLKLKKSGDGYVTTKGHTTRKNVELCLLARRGRPRILSKSVRELIAAPRRQHSRKPDEQYPRIMQLCAGPYLELFARQRWPGWHSWGDEADTFTERSPNGGSQRHD